jgi:hypothetical protein
VADGDNGTITSAANRRVFLHEYSFEAAALFNPSIVNHPNQAGVPVGGRRFRTRALSSLSTPVRALFYATYTAYTGRAIRSELIETRDFATFRMAA